MNELNSLLVFIFGAAIGSFLNVLILRLPEEKKLGGRSSCPHCHKFLGPMELIPIFSFMALGGRCQSCKNKISWRYPVIEFATAVLFLAWWVFVQPSDLLSWLLLVKLWFLSAFCVAVFVIDLEHFLILDILVFPALIFFLLYNILSDTLMSTLGQGLTLAGFKAVLVTALPLYLIWYFSKGKFLGLGDVKLMLPLGMAVGWPAVLVGIFFAIFTGSLVGLALLIWGKKNLKSPLPFGCFLVTGALFAVVWAQPLIKWYLALLGI